jgi:hypothetical protein
MDNFIVTLINKNYLKQKNNADVGINTYYPEDDYLDTSGWMRYKDN